MWVIYAGDRREEQKAKGIQREIKPVRKEQEQGDYEHRAAQEG